MSQLQGFGLRALKKYWELIPLVSALSCAAAGAVGFSIYAATTKSDVRINKSSELPPWERVDFTKKQKILTINQQYKKNEELEKLREEIGSYKC